MTQKIHIIDVTNRDGVQTARVGMSKLQKTMLNLYLSRLGIYQTELGFPFSIQEKNYINDFVKFLDKGSKDVDELYSTGDFAFKFNKSVQGTQALLEALGLDKFSSNVAEQVGNKLSQIAREKGITNRLKLMDELEAQVGEDVLTKSGLRLYSPEIIQLAQEYGSRYFSGFSSPKEKAVGIAIKPINVTM